MEDSRVKDIMENALEAQEVLNTLDELSEFRGLFPLYTKQGLADRWGVDRQTVNNWATRHTDFCKPVESLIIGSAQYYPITEVKRYEQQRGLL